MVSASGAGPNHDWIFVQQDGVSGDQEEEIVFQYDTADDDVSGDDDEDGADDNEDDDGALYDYYLDQLTEVPVKKRFIDWEEEPSGVPSGNVSGLFYHDKAGGSLYTPFILDDPRPDSSLSFLHEPAVVLSSTGGLLLCRGRLSLMYYVCNPLTLEWAAIPVQINDHAASDAVLVLDASDGHYHIVCAYRIDDYDPDREYYYDDDDVAYGFEIFSSRRWGWMTSNWVSFVVLGSGVAAAGAAHWRTKGNLVVSYATEADSWRETAPPEWEDAGEAMWELAEIAGRLCCTWMRGPKAVVYVLEENWREIRTLEVGCGGGGETKKEDLPRTMRSQGGKELLFLVRSIESCGWEVVAKELESALGRSMIGQNYWNLLPHFVPYVSSFLHVMSEPEGPSHQSENSQSLAVSMQSMKESPTDGHDPEISEKEFMESPTEGWLFL